VSPNNVPARGWTHAALVPGLDYRPPPQPPAPGHKPNPLPTWPGRFLTQPPAMRGDDVRQWQQAMRRRGHPLAADGVYGPQSEQVCRAFQRDAALRVDGIVGPATWTAAFRAAPQPAPTA